MIVELIIIVGASFFLGFYCTDLGLGLSGTLAHLLDAPTLICILFLSLPLLFRKGMGKDFFRAFPMQLKNRYTFSHKKGKFTFEKKTVTFSLAQMKRSLDAVEFMQKQILYSGILIVILPAIFMLSRLEDIAAIGPNVAVTLIAVFYTTVLELLLLPLQIEVKRRIINYMEEE